MLLCGLWHGPSWTFVLWGGYHGIALCIQRLWSRLDARLPALIGWLITMLTVMFGWVVFRSADLSHAAAIFKQLVFPAPGVVWIFPFALFAVAATAVVHLAEVSGKIDIHNLSLDAWYTPAFLFAMLWMVVIFHPEGFRPFVYSGF
jgi:alginate O-acetyltransferase complex protein AlgI